MRNYILSALLTGLSLNAQAAIPNLIANYAADPAGVTFKEIATATNKVLTPRDLDFDSAGNLWIVNKGTEASGSSTVKIYNPGLATARYRYQIDVNASHFMCLATAIAFGDNGNFATSAGVLDANHTETNGGFTGPTLWNGDSTIYVKPNNGNGSHIDMLHESPYSMGIAHEKGNAYWVFDAFSHDIVRYDFVKPHVPGGDDHSDGLIRRFPEVAVKWISQDIPCHVVVDKAKGWLYIVDGGNKRILRLDIASGTPNGAPAKPQEEETKEYVKMAGAKWEVVTDKNLIQPTGIDVLDNNLVVSDHSTGEIILYDISALPAKETARIATGGKGVMGLVIGPNGRIWFVNAITNKVMMAEPKPNLVALRPRGREAKARVNIRLLPGQGPVAIDGRVRVLGNLLRSY